MGGKTFKDETGKAKASRIPTRHLKQLEAQVVAQFGPFVRKIEMVTCLEILPKATHGDIDFVVLVNDDSRNKIRDHCKQLGFETRANGPMEHILFFFEPEGEETYYCQIDLIASGSEIGYDTYKYFYSKPVAFNSVVGHFARSIGYKFSTDGFMLHATDRRKQNRYVKLTDDLRKAYFIMQLEEPDDDFIFSSPECFASWIMRSPRFDTEYFRANYNMKAHRDSYADEFCAAVYRYCHLCSVKSDIPQTKIDYSLEEDPDFRHLLKREEMVLGKDIYDKVVEQIDEWSKKATPIVTGAFVIGLGYKPGPLIGQIIEDVSSKFTAEDSQNDIAKYILETYK